MWLHDIPGLAQDHTIFTADIENTAVLHWAVHIAGMFSQQKKSLKLIPEATSRVDPDSSLVSLVLTIVLYQENKHKDVCVVYPAVCQGRSVLTRWFTLYILLEKKYTTMFTSAGLCNIFKAGIILCMRPANERWRYDVMSSPTGWSHTQNYPCKE